MKVGRCLIIYLSLDKPLGPMAPPLGLFLLRPTNQYINQSTSDLYELQNTVDKSFNQLIEHDLCPGDEVLQDINQTFRQLTIIGIHNAQFDITKIAVATSLFSDHVCNC